MKCIDRSEFQYALVSSLRSAEEQTVCLSGRQKPVKSGPEKCSV